MNLTQIGPQTPAQPGSWIPDWMRYHCSLNGMPKARAAVRVGRWRMSISVGCMPSLSRREARRHSS